MSTQIEGGNWYQECQQLRAQLAEAQMETKKHRANAQAALNQLQSQAAQLAGMQEALRELKVIKDETHQILEATNPWVNGNPDRSHLDLFHMGCCALRSWGASMTAISALSTPASEWEKRVQGLVEALEYCSGDDALAVDPEGKFDVESANEWKKILARDTLAKYGRQVYQDVPLDDTTLERVANSINSRQDSKESKA